MKKKIQSYKLEDFLPIGEEPKSIFRIYCIFLAVLFLLSFQFFYHFWHFQVEQEWILKNEGYLMNTEYFAQLIKQGYNGLHYLYIWCLGLGIANYFSHTSGSKSIYLMKRLPNPWELYVRVWSFPLFFAVSTAILTILLLLLYYQFYLYSAVPDTIPENQLEIFIDIWFQGGEKYAEIRKYH